MMRSKPWQSPVMALVALVMLVSATGVANARDLPDFTVLAKETSPAVVNISTRQKAEHGGKQGFPHGLEIPDFPKGGPWDDFFKHFFGEKDQQQGPGNGAPDDDYEARSLGSGFIIDPDGYILTNNHVVDGADEIIVRLSDRRELEAKVIGFDKRSDIALLKVKADHLPVVKIGSISHLQVGEWVMAIGSPFGFDHSVSVGVVSALGRALPNENYVPFIQTDVAINPGNSGGPLFNLDGEVVGINSQIYSRTGGFMGLSFAIPIDVAMDAVKQIKDKGYVSRGWLGVLIQDVTRELAESFGMGKPSGALVAKVLKDSPAEKAGLQVGDIILAYNGKPVDYSSDLPPLVGRTPVNSTAKLKVMRDGKTISVPVTIGELPAEENLAASGQPGKAQDDGLGLAVEDLSQEQRDKLELGKYGVAVSTVDDGPARDAGIRPGDVIVKLNNKNVKNIKEFREIVSGLPKGKSVPVLVQRSNGPLFLALRVPED